MSRVRNRLDTVSKAVSGTHTELFSKIARLKPNASKARINAENTVGSRDNVEEGAVTPVLANASTCSSSTTPKPLSDPSSTSPSVPTASPLNANAFASSHSLTSPQAATNLSLHEPKDVKVRRVVPAVKASCARKQEDVKPLLSEAESKSTMSKQTTALFHPSTFSVSLDETYNYLAHHINSYFGSTTKFEDKKVDIADSFSVSSQDHPAGDLTPVSDKTDPAAPVTPPSAKRGLGQYLSYSSPSVQAFVGSYLAPLVPKFRTVESRGAAVEEKLEETVKQMETTISKEQKTAEEKAKKLLLQREKVGVEKCLTLHFN